MSFPQYPKYKDSGIEWFGKVPEHWTATHLKRVVDPDRQITYGIVQAGMHVQDGIPYIRPADMADETGVVSFETMLRTSPEIALAYSRSMIKTGDLVCSIGPSFGKVMVTPPKLDGANLTQGTARVAITEDNCPRFFFWVLRSVNSVAQWESSVGGATFRALNLGPLAETAIFVPEKWEQAAIARFLNRETEKIDALVAEQRRLIELLKEKRQSIISHAITKGLNANAPLKPSGIEWLGDVPAHWDVVAIKHLVATPVIDGPHESPIKYDIGVPFVSAEATSMGSIDFAKIWGYISAEDHARYSRRYRPQRNDILLVKLGATTGASVIVETDDEFNIWVPLAAIRLLAGVEPRFVLHVLRSDNLRRAYELNWTLGTQQTLGLGTIANLRIPIPPFSEQQTVAAHIDSILPLFDALSTEAERAIELLRERRTALISAAVTGKIDVRESREADAA